MCRESRRGAEAATSSARSCGPRVLKLMNDRQLDALIYPTWSNPPRLIGDLNTPGGDNNQLFAPSTGFPAITVPMGYTHGDTLPAGLQFFGRPWSEATLSGSRMPTSRRRTIASRRRLRPRSTPDEYEYSLLVKRILIANRGEIAVRIIRACREMGLSPDRRLFRVRSRRAARPLRGPRLRHRPERAAGELSEHRPPHRRRQAGGRRCGASRLWVPRRERGVCPRRPRRRPHVHRPLA